MTYSADVLIPANSGTRTEGLRAFYDNGSGRFLTTATLPYTFFWNEHTLCVGFLIQCIHWELYKGICHHSSVILQKKNHHTNILCIQLYISGWSTVSKKCTKLLSCFTIPNSPSEQLPYIFHYGQSKLLQIQCVIYLRLLTNLMSNCSIKAQRMHEFQPNKFPNFELLGGRK